jgi:hypothetical protein
LKSVFNSLFNKKMENTLINNPHLLNPACNLILFLNLEILQLLFEAKKMNTTWYSKMM